jgi:hypothetical protein
MLKGELKEDTTVNNKGTKLDEEKEGVAVAAKFAWVEASQTILSNFSTFFNGCIDSSLNTVIYSILSSYSQSSTVFSAFLEILWAVSSATFPVIFTVMSVFRLACFSAFFEAVTTVYSVLRVAFITTVFTFSATSVIFVVSFKVVVFVVIVVFVVVDVVFELLFGW